MVAITLRVNPLVWHNSWTAIAFRAGQVLRTRTYEVEIVDRLGAGDYARIRDLARQYVAIVQKSRPQVS